MNNSTRSLIINTIKFYQSRNFSEEEMISDISGLINVSREDLLSILDDIKKDAK